MAGKMERRIGLDCRGKFTGGSGCFSASHGASKKSRKAESMDIGLVNE